MMLSKQSTVLICLVLFYMDSEVLFLSSTELRIGTGMEARGATFLRVAKGGLPSLRDMESSVPLPSVQ